LLPTHTLKNNKIKNNLFSRKQNDSDGSRIKKANPNTGKQTLKKPCIRQDYYIAIGKVYRAALDAIER